uniref:uncharacterized protein LOC105350492 isoform X1 n=1 Tax=Fragaria vesca subsp. vesca TaxID=101020 RepID=UPI0005CB2A9C|nr:PREDICTED: uncharacterized protein LOC105350492 isoform X1 [Fragaria vesca subsp. vesca]
MAGIISLKALVDKESNKVIFIESDNDFVDVLFSLLTIPIGTIVKLTSRQSVPLHIGCLNNLYESVAKIDAQHFENEAYRDMLLCPQNRADSYCKNLKLKIDDYVPKGYFLCESWNCTFFENRLLSHYKGDRCQCGRCMNLSCTLTGPSLSKQDGSIFVKKASRLMITDDLHVMSPLSAATCSLITNLGLGNENSEVEQMSFKVDVNQVMELLMSSLVSKTPLSEILLRNKEQKLTSENLCGRICIGLPDSRDALIENEEKISVKLTVIKSKNIVCYAEAGEDFVNLLFSFLTLPLGVILRHMQDAPWDGCIDHLFKSAHDLDDQYLKSNYHREILLGSKTCPGFSYENYFFGTEDGFVAPYYYAFWWNSERRLRDILTTDKSLIPSNAVTVPLKLKNNQSPQGYLKGATMFTVTDKLIIRPLSPILGFSVLNELKVPIADIKEETVEVGKVEALHLLVASFVCDSALTNVFFRQLNKDCDPTF